MLKMQSHEICFPDRTRRTLLDSDSRKYKENDKILFIPLAWNFYNEIQERILKTRDNKNDWFLRYFPEVKLERR